MFVQSAVAALLHLREFADRLIAFSSGPGEFFLRLSPSFLHELLERLKLILEPKGMDGFLSESE
ncbi:hypothetical protein [Singulisphaera acidiphila]|uniref:hypothetical protein n=1 Tax=Singulisphaera acidiphila TaxID=466153 RepID=UPI0002F41E87|nr:hypothetical protein [Singulisphaera acidiphila]